MKLKTFLSLAAALALLSAGEDSFEQTSSGNVEDESGKVVKTIYVSAFTSRGRGYRRRKDSLSRWVAATNPESLSNKEIDAISGATLRTGSQKFTWDLTGSDGKKVPDGKYFVKLEGTLYWSSNVLYSSQVEISGGIKAGKVQKSRSEESNSQNGDMIQNVRIEKTL